MHKDISGRTRKTIRRMPYRAIPTAQRLAHCTAPGKMQLRFEANLRISLIGTGSWKPCTDGESTVEKTDTLLTSPQVSIQALFWPLKLSQEGELGFCYLLLANSLSAWKQSRASGLLCNDKGQLILQGWNISIKVNVSCVAHFALAPYFSERVISWHRGFSAVLIPHRFSSSSSRRLRGSQLVFPEITCFCREYVICDIPLASFIPCVSTSLVFNITVTPPK